MTKDSLNNGSHQISRFVQSLLYLECECEEIVLGAEVLGAAVGPVQLQLQLLDPGVALLNVALHLKFQSNDSNHELNMISGQPCNSQL